MFKGSVGTSLYSPSNPQIGGYPGNANLNNKDMFNAPGNTNTNNNQYGLNTNLYPNNNPYNTQLGANTNTNQWPNQNNHNQFGASAGNSWTQNRDLNAANTNTNNNNAAYSNPNSPYFYNNDGHRMMVSCLIIFFSFIAISLFHI